MASTSKHHHEVGVFGQGLCSVPMWSSGGPAGFCDAPAYGERPPSPERMNYCIMEMQRDDNRYNGYVPGLACIGHGGPRVRTFMDGTAWCAVLPDFIDLQVSKAGFGETRESAIKALGVQP